MSVNDKWHYCHNSEVLVGSRAMRDRHLRLLGYIILQVSQQRQLPHTIHISMFYNNNYRSCILFVPDEHFHLISFDSCLIFQSDGQT